MKREFWGIDGEIWWWNRYIITTIFNAQKRVLKNTPCKIGQMFKRKGGGGQRPFEQCSKKLHFSLGMASLSWARNIIFSGLDHRATGNHGQTKWVQCRQNSIFLTQIILICAVETKFYILNTNYDPQPGEQLGVCHHPDGRNSHLRLYPWGTNPTTNDPASCIWMSCPLNDKDNANRKKKTKTKTTTKTNPHTMPLLPAFGCPLTTLTTQIHSMSTLAVTLSVFTKFQISMSKIVPLVPGR